MMDFDSSNMKMPLNFLNNIHHTHLASMTIQYTKINTMKIIISYSQNIFFFYTEQEKGSGINFCHSHHQFYREQ